MGTWKPLLSVFTDSLSHYVLILMILNLCCSITSLQVMSVLPVSPTAIQSRDSVKTNYGEKVNKDGIKRISNIEGITAGIQKNLKTMKTSSPVSEKKETQRKASKTSILSKSGLRTDKRIFSIVPGSAPTGITRDQRNNMAKGVIRDQRGFLKHNQQHRTDSNSRLRRSQPPGAGPNQNTRLKDAKGVISPSMTLQPSGSMELPPGEKYESPAEQLDDKREDMLEMLLAQGYSHTVLPDNMSLYPHILNATEMEEMEGEEGEEGPESEGHEGYEGNEEHERNEGNEANENEAEQNKKYRGSEGQEKKDKEIRQKTQSSKQARNNWEIESSMTELLPLDSSLYEYYYEYYYDTMATVDYQNKWEKANKYDHAAIKPTPTLRNQPTNVQLGIGKERFGSSVGPGLTPEAGSKAKIMDSGMKKVKTTDNINLPASATFGIIVGCLIGFWVILGPLVCLVCKFRDQEKAKKKRLNQRINDPNANNGIMEAMIMSELDTKKPLSARRQMGMEFHKQAVAFRTQLSRQRDRDSKYWTLSSDKTELETFHDAYETPELIP